MGVWGLGFRVWGFLGLRVSGLGSWVWGFGVLGLWRGVLVFGVWS